MPDSTTILQTTGPVLTKVFKADGTTESYANAESFHFKDYPLADLRSLHSLLDRIQGSRTRCVIRGKAKGEGMVPGNAEGTVLRNNENFLDTPHHWFLVDIDGYSPGFADPIRETEQAVLDFIDDVLPACFKTASFRWHLSSSAGMPGKEGILKCHVWFWSKTAYTSAQMSAWAKTVGTRIDAAVYRRVQIHYTADPIFEEGREDPVPVRSGWHQGETDEVDLVIDPEILSNAHASVSGEGGNDAKLTDPSEKPGLIGAFHKVFDAEHVLTEFLGDEFEQVSQRRYTWRNGGGTPEGVWVHDDQMHVGSSHNTWPIDGISNLWDLVRVFKFGDLDGDTGPEEFESLGQDQVGRRPSDLAMKEWAAALPELKEHVVDERQSELERLREVIQACGDHYDLENVAAVAVQQAKLTATEREMLVQTFRARSRDLGTQLPVATIRRMLNPPFVRNTEAPRWVEDWVWVREMDGFMNTKTKMFSSERSYNAEYDRLMGPYADEDGVVPRASQMSLNEWGLPLVDRALYYPDADITFEEEGIRYVNTFRPDVMTPMPENFSKKDLEAISVVERHAELLIPNEWERALFIDYLAYCVKYPGKKIRWAPVLKGVEGDGKSAFVQLMGHVLGAQNVRVLDNATLEGSDFTAWRVGQCFTGVEEVKLHGANRHDVYNKLKTPLSNDTIEIHPKGRDPYTVPNTTNYLLLTNFDDGLPINDNDRRCMFIRSPFLTKEDLQAKLKELGYPTPSAYYDRLFDFAIKDHKGALRKWLMERKLHPDFRADGRAPETDARSLAVDMSLRDDDEAIASVIEDGGFGIYPNLIAVSCLNDALFNQHGIKLHTSRVKAVLAAHGFEMYSKGQVKWSGRNYRFYFKGTRPANAAAEAARLESDRQSKVVEDDFAD